MRVCPKCGHIEDAAWSHDFWNKEKDYCHVAEFRRMQPNLAEQLDVGHRVVVDEHYAYRKRGKGRFLVERMPIYLYMGKLDNFNSRGSKREKSSRTTQDIFQKKLLEET